LNKGLVKDHSDKLKRVITLDESVSEI